MFCNNCGSKVAEGSNFCSVCGSRIVAPEAFQEERTGFAHHEYEPEISYVTEKKPTVAFDWSSVKDEPHRRDVSDIVSPWGPTEQEKKAEPAKLEEDQRTRTMSFIDILKKDREDKVAAADDQARPVTERAEVEADYAPFQEPQAPSYYMPPMYENLNSQPAEPVAEEPAIQQSDFEEPASFKENRELEAELAAIISAGKLDHESEIAEEYLAMDEYASDRSTEELTYVDERFGKHAAESVESLESLLDELDSDAEEDFEAADIDVPEEEGETYSDIFEPIDESLEDATAFVDYETLMAELTNLGQVEPISEPSYEEAASDKEAAVYEEETFEEAVEEAIEEVVAAPVEDPRLAEIEELKKRLAELMGEAQEEEKAPESASDITAFVEALNAESEAPVYEEEAFVSPIFEELEAEEEDEAEAAREDTAVIDIVEEQTEAVEEAIAVEEAAVAEETVAVEEATVEKVAATEEELPLIDPTPVVEEELSLLGNEVEEEETTEDNEENPTTDAMSVEELERDLFGEVSEEDIVAEETKKIDKFYTLYKKNEEFQRLLDEEYDRLRSEEAEEVPTVSAILDKAEEAKAVSQDAGQAVADAASVVAAPVTELIQDEEESSGKGGTALTVIAVIVAVLLVILLAVILVLNFAPDSGIALKLDSIIETITSYFSVLDAPGNLLL